MERPTDEVRCAVWTARVVRSAVQTPAFAYVAVVAYARSRDERILQWRSFSNCYIGARDPEPLGDLSRIPCVRSSENS
jgi:hypothetical protein